MRLVPSVSAITLVAVAACAPRRELPPAPPPTPVAIAVPTPAPLGGDWRDWPLSPGTWSYRRDARGSLALFGRMGTDADVTLRCDRAARQLYLSRSGAAATPLTIRTTSATRSLAVRPTGGTPPYVAVALAPGDPLLDAMAFSRGRFTLERADEPPLVVPAWAEIGRTIEDCRG